MSMNPYHAVDDPKKVTKLAESIATNGWQGAPLVAIDEMRLLTGVHRYEAAHAVLGWQDSEIPMILLDEIFVEDGLNLAESFDDNGPFGDLDFQVRLPYVCSLLSKDIRAKYGIEIEV